MTFGSHDDKPSGSGSVRVCHSATKTNRADVVTAYIHQDEPGKSTSLEADTHSDVGVADLLEVSVRSFPNSSEFS